jgi:hypothetical protein
MSENKKIIGEYTFQLFGRENSFLNGMGDIFDFRKNINKYNTSNSDKEADEKSIRSDWFAIGNDMKKVIISTINNYE